MWLWKGCGLTAEEAARVGREGARRDERASEPPSPRPARLPCPSLTSCPRVHAFHGILGTNVPPCLSHPIPNLQFRCPEPSRSKRLLGWSEQPPCPSACDHRPPGPHGELSSRNENLGLRDRERETTRGRERSIPRFGAGFPAPPPSCQVYLNLYFK